MSLSSLLADIQELEYKRSVPDGTRDPHECSAELFRVLMHPTRLAILDMLRDGEECVCHIGAALGQRQAYVSQQVAVLRKAGFIADERRGARIYYHVTQAGLYELLDAARDLLGLPAPRSWAHQRLPDCRCPRCAPESVMIPVTTIVSMQGSESCA